MRRNPMSAGRRVDQAGHQGRPDCDREPQACATTPVPRHRRARSCGPRSWRMKRRGCCRRAGVSVLREPARCRALARAQAAVFLHFDGAETPCSTGASLGFPGRVASREADAGRRCTADSSRSRFRPTTSPIISSTTTATSTSTHRRGSLLIEFGDISCSKQHEWLKSRLTS